MAEALQFARQFTVLVFAEDLAILDGEILQAKRVGGECHKVTTSDPHALVDRTKAALGLLGGLPHESFKGLRLRLNVPR